MHIKSSATSNFKQIDAMIRRLQSLETHQAEYGYFEGDIHQESGMDISDLAYLLNEDRPFMDYAEDLTARHFEITSQWKRDIWQYLKGTGTIKTLLREFGRVGEINVQASIDVGDWDANEPKWLAFKIEKYGSQAAAPLIASGELYDSVSSKVTRVDAIND